MRYAINKNTFLIKASERSSTKILEKGKEIYSKVDALTIINDSCSFYRFSLNYRISESKKEFNKNYKLPLIIDNEQKIIFFPLKSITSKNNIWVSYNNLTTFIRKKDNTILIFNDGSSFIVPVSYSIISAQVSKCFILEKKI